MTKRADTPGLGARIKARRLEKGLTQAQLGEPRFSSAYVSLIECGHRKPSEEILTFLAERLDLQVEELATGIPPGLAARLELKLHDARRRLDAGDGRGSTETVTEVLESARRHGLHRVEARAHELLGGIADRASRHDVAIEHYERAVRRWEGEPIHLRADAVAGVARCTWILGNPQMAIHILDSYRRDLESSGQPHPAALMRTYTEVISPYFSVGLPEKAREAAHEALRLESKVDNQDDIACMHLTVARTLVYEGQFTDALVSIRRAEEIYLAGGWRNKAAKARIAEGIMLGDRAAYVAARDKLMSALELLKESPNLLDEALALNELGRVLREMGRPEEALSYLQRVPSLTGEPDVGNLAMNARETGLCLKERDPLAAEEFLLRAVDLCRDSGASSQLATTFKALGDLLVSRGQLERAVSAYREGIEILEASGSAGV